MNKAIVLGNLTRDPELKHTNSNQAVCAFGIAHNKKYTTAAGEKKEEVTFLDCEAWGKTAELIGQYFAKGKPILIEGRLKLDQWEDKETKAKRSKVKIVVESFTFVGKGDGDGTQAAKPVGAGAGKPVLIDEDVPF